MLKGVPKKFVGQGAKAPRNKVVKQAVANSANTKTFKEMMKTKKGIAMGAGAAVVGGLAYSGRRGEGSSGGRTSMYKY